LNSFEQETLARLAVVIDERKRRHVADAVPHAAADGFGATDTSKLAHHEHPVVVPQSSQTKQCPDTFIRMDWQCEHWSPV